MQDSANQVLVVGAILIANAGGIVAAFVAMRVAIAIGNTRMEERDKFYMEKFRQQEKDLNGLGGLLRKTTTGDQL